MTVAWIIVVALGVDAGADASTEVAGPLQSAVYARPFIVDGQRAAVGGYADLSFDYAVEDGVGEGPGFNFRRFNLFVFSQIARSVRFISEVEIEPGHEEVRLESAHVDVEVAPELVLRAGILLPPLGAFNQAHDAPLWDFVDRPLVSTTLIPATFSEAGAGVHGTLALPALDLDYQLYVTQGLGDEVVDNELGRTSIPAGRATALFEEDNNGSPALTGRVAARLSSRAEIGLSAWHGRYNTDVVDGTRVAPSRALTLAALDARLETLWLQVRGEAAYAWIEVPRPLVPLFGRRQFGAHLDVVAPLLRFDALSLEGNQLSAGARFEHVDYNLGELTTTREPAGEHVTRLTTTIALRLAADTVVRASYGYQWTVDLVGNAAARMAIAQLGVATYF